MSTRATYQFTQTENHPTITYYIHHDGYLEGAAQYFFNMFNYEDDDSRGGYADRFHRANTRAEFTMSHATHGDTEFQYTVSVENGELHLRALELYWPRPDSDFRSSSLRYKGLLSDFVNKYARQDAALPIVNNRTQTNLFKEFKEKVDYVVNCAVQGRTGNGSYNLTEAKKLATLLKLPNSVHTILELMDEWYKARFRGESNDPQLVTLLAEDLYSKWSR